MKSIFQIVILSFCCGAVSAASYIGAYTGQVAFETIHLSDSGSNDKEIIKGDLYGFEAGHFLSNSFAIELSHLTSQLERVEASGDSPSAFNYEAKGQYALTTLGARWFLADYLNIKFGMMRREYDPGIKKQPGFSDIEEEKEVVRDGYYGMGVGITFSKLQFFYDLTFVSRSRFENTKLNSWGVRLFF